MQRVKLFLKHLRRRLTGYAVRLVSFLILLLSDKQAKALANFAGNSMYKLAGVNRKRILDNLKRIFGDNMSEDDRHKMARRVCRNLAHTVMESTRLVKMSPETVRVKADENGAEKRLHQYLQNGKSVMIMTAHYGNWELFAARIAQIAPLTVLARKNDDSNIQTLITRVRNHHGVRVLDRSDPAAPKEMIRMGREGGHILGILMDQDTKKVQNIYSDFMGIPALTPSGPASIAVRNLYVVFTGVLKPLGNGNHSVILNGPIPIPDTGDKNRDIQHLTDRFNADLSQMILDDPQYWVWNHRRWRHSPDSGSKGSTCPG